MASEWYTCRNARERAGPFSSRQLKEFAASGQFCPNDLVWKKGMKEWAEARRLRGLFQEAPVEQVELQARAPKRAVPVASPAPDAFDRSVSAQVPQQGPIIIHCRACHKPIAASAATCPGCGAPNDFVHPEIQRFALSLKQRNFLPADSRVSWQGYRVWGTGMKKHPGRDSDPRVWGHKLTIVSMLVGLLGCFVDVVGPLLVAIASIMALVGLVGILIGSLSDTVPIDQAVEFQLDFSHAPPHWSSNEEEYWAEVRRFFDV